MDYCVSVFCENVNRSAINEYGVDRVSVIEDLAGGRDDAPTATAHAR